MKFEFIYTHGPHKGTIEICENLGDFNKQHVNFKHFYMPTSVEKSEVYFLEGVVPLFKGKGYPKNSEIVIKGNCHFAYHTSTKPIRKVLFQMVKAFKPEPHILAVSDMSAKHYVNLGFKNVQTCEGFMFRDYDSLSSLKPQEENFLFIGQNGYLKGLDRSVDLFLMLKNENIISSNQKFFIVGKNKDYLESCGYDLNVLENKGVVLLGQMADINPILSISRFQLHLARYEPNAVSIMEGMAAGLIPILSDFTGNLNHIKETGFDPLVGQTKGKMFNVNLEKVVKILETPKSIDLKDFAERYSKTKGVTRWKNAIDQLLQSS